MNLFSMHLFLHFAQLLFWYLEQDKCITNIFYWLYSLNYIIICISLLKSKKRTCFLQQISLRYLLLFYRSTNKIFSMNIKIKESFVYVNTIIMFLILKKTCNFVYNPLGQKLNIIFEYEWFNNVVHNFLLSYLWSNVLVE